MRRVILAGVLVLLAASAALARHHAWVGGVGIGPFGPSFVGGPSSTGGGGCVADGKTDWSNACDIPMGVALGIL